MTKDDILRRYSMKEILSRHGIKLNAAGFCRCPFHARDNTPSLKVYPNNSWYCFGCEKGGDVIKFVQLIDGLSFADACKWISGEELAGSTRRRIVAHRLAISAELKESQKRIDSENELINEISGYRKIMTAAKRKAAIYQDLSIEAMWIYVEVYSMAYIEWAMKSDKLDSFFQEDTSKKYYKSNRKK